MSDPEHDIPREASWLEEEIQRVVENFQERTLDCMTGAFNRLIYVASLRDYNTGRFHHYGLETTHSSEAVDAGLRRCHAQVFQTLLTLSLEQQTQDLLRLFDSLQTNKERLVKVWQQLRAYEILPPEDCHLLERELFTKNVEIILQILKQTSLWELLNDPHDDPDDLP